MKKLSIVPMLAISLIFACINCLAETDCVVDEYDLTICAYIPRIYDNMQSLGSRKYNRQKIVGKLLMCYRDGTGPAEILIEGLENKTQKLSTGAKIVYTVTTGSDMFPTRVVLMGDNKKGKFETPSVMFYMDAEPNYNLGADDPENSLLIVLAGRGTTCKDSKYGGRRINVVSGYLSGSLGCGCRAYGHVSPTRYADWRGPMCSMVSDPAAVYGMWKCKYRRSYCACIDD